MKILNLYAGIGGNRIADASSQYFGKYFVGMVDGCPCASGKSFHGVLNKMLDYNDDNSK